jgi:Hydrazine synthase alpha subunit middle domain
MHATKLKTLAGTILAMGLLLGSLLWLSSSLAGKPNSKGPFNITIPQVSTDSTIKYDYDIVYVRTPRNGNAPHSSRWADASLPLNVDAEGDLMLLHPDGSEERLVAGGKGSVTDPYVSFDGEWVYYSRFEDLKDRKEHGGAAADIYKIQVKTRQIVRLTHQEFTPNTGAAHWAKDYRTPEPGKTTQPYPICNLGPCPLPGGKVIFTSNRNGFEMPRGNNMGFNIPFQLFVMDGDGSNVEMIGHLNIASALHPVILKDGRVMFSTLEDQGFRNDLDWGIWSIHPDGTRWNPIVSAFGGSAFHFQTQLSDENIVVAFYYGGKNEGFGTFVKLPLQPPTGSYAFGPAYRGDVRNAAPGADLSMRGFKPYGMEALTRFAHGGDWPALSSVPGKDDAPRMGKVTQPAGAPDNHLLCTYSPGNAHFASAHTVKRPGETLLDAGIYLIKSGKPIDEPGQMFLIKNDPNYNEQWPRALVPCKRIYGVAEPRSLKPLANDGKLSSQLPEGTPFGLIGASSLYKRESFPNGMVRPGEVTATWPGKEKAPYRRWEEGNWGSQGADAGLYTNDQIHAIRILAMEPTTARRNGPKAGRLFYNHARERLRILAEIPVRKFTSGGKQPTDPDGNPDTSFLAKIPADVPFTFQTLDKNGMVLNMAQTWHQVRPGEIRNDCGGCHAHSQKPTLFEDTAAARPNYTVVDAVTRTPLLTTKQKDQSGKQWDVKDETGLRFEKGVKNVEFHRDVKPILERSCVACHTQKTAKPAGSLVLDDNQLRSDHIAHRVPGAYYRLASDPRALFGHKPLQESGWGEGMRKSRYIWAFQSRRSLLVWKIFGARLDGFSNDDHPMEAVPGDPTTLQLKGQPIALTPQNRSQADVGYTGSVMPPPEAVAGDYVGPDGQKIKVAPLSDEDRLTLVRWIDLGCPIDLDYDAANPRERGYGWMLDDTRPTLTLTYPRTGANPPLTRILVGMHDYYTGLDMDSFQVAADFPLDGAAAGQNLASKFNVKSPGVWELTLAKPLTELPKGKITVSVKDRQGNLTRIERTFAVVARP